MNLGCSIKEFQYIEVDAKRYLMIFIMNKTPHQTIFSKQTVSLFMPVAPKNALTNNGNISVTRAYSESFCRKNAYLN